VSADPDEQRRASRERWEGAAAGWTAEREHFSRALAPVTAWMLDAAQLRPGMTVLELAAGPGDTGLQALERLRPGGRLVSTDGAEAMVQAAAARGRELGVGQDEAEFTAMELEWIDRPTASVDAVLCRFGYMLAVDPDAALQETRRVLRPGGRVALAVWAPADENPWSPGRYFQQLGHTPAPGPDEPGPFRLGDPADLRERLESAGLVDPRIEQVAVAFEADSLDELWEREARLSPTARRLLSELAPAEVYALRDTVDAAWERYVRDDGSVAVPGSVLCAVAEA
jgi:ubiquinone/menaquinone biosynthesis C-methylase UbiE